MRRPDNRFTIVLTFSQESIHAVASQDSEELPEGVGELLTVEAVKLPGKGNTVVVVEHDEATLRAADWLVDVGPGAGRAGGHIAAIGTPADVARADTPTGRLLRGEIALAVPDARRKGSGLEIRVEGARAFNLKEIDVRFPLADEHGQRGVAGSRRVRASLRAEFPSCCSGLNAPGFLRSGIIAYRWPRRSQASDWRQFCSASLMFLVI
jgi:hypothetical protein